MNPEAMNLKGSKKDYIGVEVRNERKKLYSHITISNMKEKIEKKVFTRATMS